VFFFFFYRKIFLISMEPLYTQKTSFFSFSKISF